MSQGRSRRGSMRFSKEKQEKKATTTKLKSGKEAPKSQGDGGGGKDSKPTNQKKAEDKAKLNVGLGTSNQKKAEDKADVNVGVANRTTQNFIDDLKDAYKTGLFTGGNKTKEFMDKYNLDSQDIVKLRTGIDQGLGTIMGGKGNVLSNVVGELRAEGGIKDFFESPDFLQQRSSEIFEPGMTKYDREPMTGLMGLSPVVNIGLKGLDLIAGGSSQGLRGLVYGRDVLGLTGEDLDNFAASVANDSNLYNQIMATPRMQEYQLNEFRAEANKQAMAKRQGQGDPNPISGTQPGEGADGGESDTDTGSGTFTPTPQNFYTFFDPNLGRYRSGTYDEYLQYVTAKDGGIIQLENGGNTEEEQFIKDNKMVNLRNILAYIDENKFLKDQLENMNTESKAQESVRNKSQRLLNEEDKLLADMLKKRFSDLEGITGLTVNSGDAVKMAEEDQPAKGILNIEIPSDLGPALREDLKFFPRLKDSGLSLLMEALRKSDISTGSANQFIEEALNNFVAAGIIPPNTSYNQLTDPFKDLVTREAAMIANSMAKPIDYLEGRDMESMQLPNMSFDTPDRGRVELPMTILKGKEGDENMIRRSTSTQDPTMYNVADGGIIGLKQGGMNDMMQANELMFKDPSDKEEWEYNV
jgi:hypothetical protein